MRGRGGPRAILPVDEPYRINERIRVPEVRVIVEDDEGNEENLGVMSTFAARQLAAEKELDLVEVAPQAMPPVCKVMDYGRFKYSLERKQREQHRAGRAGKAASEVKDVQLSPRIDEHDLQTKVNRAFEFLDEGHPVRMVVRFLGRDMRHPENGQRALETALEELQKLIPIRVDQAPRMEGRQLFALIRVDKAAKQRADKAAASDSSDAGEGSRDGENGSTAVKAVAVSAPALSERADASVDASAVAEGAPA
jgi:translation initiation factor IF-3